MDHIQTALLLLALIIASMLFLLHYLLNRSNTQEQTIYNLTLMVAEQCKQLSASNEALSASNEALSASNEALKTTIRNQTIDSEF